MAGDWIKVQNTTPDKPEVFQIAELLKLDPDAVVGKLVRVWVWADQQLYSGNAGSVTASLLDRVTGVTGFGEAMVQTGWLERTEAGLVFPNFERHNGKSAKQRSLTRNRVESHRKSGNASSVTDALPEKRREEKSKKKVSAHQYTDQFEEFYRHWPKRRRTNKLRAFREFEKALTKVDYETLIFRTSAFANSPEGRSDWVPLPSTWLHNERWGEDESAWEVTGVRRGPEVRVIQ